MLTISGQIDPECPRMPAGDIILPKLSVITHFYNSHDRVAEQLDRWRQIDKAALRDIEFILIDDCSDSVPDFETHGLDVRLLRIDTDIAWNLAGARNLGALNARGEWALFFDIDQMLDVGAMGALLEALPKLDQKTLYYMQVKEGLVNTIDNQKRDFHTGSFLVRMDDFRTIGLYDEDFSGHYGYEDVFLPCTWDSNGGKRTLLITPCVFERELGFTTPGLDRDLAHNRGVLDRKLAELLRPSPQEACGQKGVLRFDWHEVQLRGQLGSSPTRQRVVSRIWNGVDPFAQFPVRLFAVDPTGWNSTHPFLSKTMTELRPEVTVEVGVWKGASTLTMANALRELGVDGVVIAVDTWLGSWDQWIKPDLHAELCFLQGYPNLYMKFLANVVASGLGDFVVPCPLDSGNAAQLMAMRQVVPSVVHIDGAHDFDAVQHDLRRWWPLLADGGTMICDDYDETNAVWPEVKRAIDGFLAVTPHANFECAPYKCRFQKPV
jgi:hypothetical protein